MSLTIQEQKLVNYIGPRLNYKASDIEDAALAIFPEQGLDAFELKVLSSRKIKRETKVSCAKLIPLLLTKLLNEDVIFHQKGFAYSENFEDFIFKGKSLEQNIFGNTSVKDLFLEVAEESGVGVDLELPFKITYKKDESYLTLEQVFPDEIILETREEQKIRLVSIATSYFKVWNESLHTYKNLVNQLETMKKSIIGFDGSLCGKIIEDHLSALETPKIVENLDNKITLREYIEKNS